jgi:hypothetical protein
LLVLLLVDLRLSICPSLTCACVAGTVHTSDGPARRRLRQDRPPRRVVFSGTLYSGMHTQVYCIRVLPRALECNGLTPIGAYTRAPACTWAAPRARAVARAP